MSSFAAWGLTLLGLAVISTVAEMLLPQGKTRNVIRSVMATIAVLVIVTPIPQLLEHGIHFDFSSDAVVTDSEYLEYVDKIKSDTVGAAASEFLKSKGYEGMEVTVALDGWTVKSASAKFVDTGMTGNDAHIHKSEITVLLAEYFGIEKEAVMVYG